MSVQNSRRQPLNRVGRSNGYQILRMSQFKIAANSDLMLLSEKACGKTPRSPLGAALFRNFYMIEVKPENLVGDRACDSDPLDGDLCKSGIEMIEPRF
jgi:hypothetical protein